MSSIQTLPTPGILKSAVLTVGNLVESPVEAACNAVVTPYTTLSDFGYFLGRKIHRVIPANNRLPAEKMRAHFEATATPRRRANIWHSTGKFFGTLASVTLFPITLAVGGAKGLITGVVKTPGNFINHYSGATAKRNKIHILLKEKKCFLLKAGYLKKLCTRKDYSNHDEWGTVASKELRRDLFKDELTQIIDHLIKKERLFLIKKEDKIDISNKSSDKYFKL